MNRPTVLIGTPVCRAGDLKGDRMKAIELSGLEGFKSLRVADVEKPKPAANQILIEVMAAGINFAELELTWVPRVDEQRKGLRERAGAIVGLRFERGSQSWR